MISEGFFSFRYLTVASAWALEINANWSALAEKPTNKKARKNRILSFRIRFFFSFNTRLYKK
ncbi:MAG: hypothetical protein ACJAWV_004355 [Flammeovirgaceae bacterium]|jgi:hypothetical protein